MTFPLPLNYFPPLRLSKQEEDSFLQWGDSLLQQTIDAYHREQFTTQEMREQKWKPIKQKRHLTVFKRRKIRSDKEYRYLCTGRIDGTLDEVVMGRYADNTSDFRRISGVYREDLVDCAVLGVIKSRSSDNPFFLSCFKWMTVESPGKGLVKNRDVCWYEQMGITRDRNGKEIGYTLTESVDLPTCPPFRECVRAKLSICYLYKRNKSGGVKVFMRGKNDAGGAVVDWVTDIKSAELWLRIEQAMPVAHAVIATALVKAGAMMSYSPDRDGKCQLCLAKASSLLSSAKECAVCHRLTCANCVSKIRVLSFRDFRIPEHENFCKRCNRLIYKVDLRVPENVHNLVEYAASSLTELESSTFSYTSSNGSQTTVVAEDEMLAAMSSTSSRSSFHSFRQPVILGINSHSPSDDTGKSDSERESTLKQPQSHASIPETPTTERQPSVMSMKDEEYTDRESEKPFITAHRGMRATRAETTYTSEEKFSHLQTCARTASTSSADSIMSRIIEMNLAAEQSLQEIETNLQLAREFSNKRT